jgi:RNA polymerase-binding transcription factor DksA
MNINDIFASRENYLAFLTCQQAAALKEFNDTTKPECKSRKWKLLRIEKVIRLIKENPDYVLGFCFNCDVKIPDDRLASEPVSIWCVPCATKHEATNRSRGGHWAYAQKTKGGGCLGEPK